jgi:pimeloyl-ACP methyl ester carboxylesterase
MPRFRASDGLELHYREIGTGRPLLCLAGLTRNGRDFDPLTDQLANTRLILLDYRGRGESQFDIDHANYTVPREARDALDLLDHLGLDRVAVLGTSRGGLIAMALAAGHRDRLSAVILNDVGPEVGPDGLARIMDYLGVPPADRDLAGAAERLKAAMEQHFPGVSLATWRRQAEAQYIETADGLSLRYDPRLRQAILNQIAAASTADSPAPDPWLLFDALKDLPVGLLHGENSDILLPETVEKMVRRHPGLRVAHVPDRGHVPFLDEPDCVHLIQTILDATDP